MEHSKIYNTYNFNSLHSSSMDILFCGSEQCKNHMSYGPAIRPYFLIVFIHSGKGIFRTKSAVYTLTEGSSFVVFPGECTYYEADGINPWTYSWIAFNSLNSDEFYSILKECSISPDFPVHISSDASNLNQLYNDMLKLCSLNFNKYSGLKITSLLWNIFYEYAVTSNNKQSSMALNLPCSPFITRAIEYLTTNYDKDISISSTAKSIGVSRSYLCVLFKNQYGISPSRFLHDYRLSTSATLLLSTNYSVSKISSMVGFNDYNYYTNQFTKYFGISPSIYRKSKRT